MVHAALCGEWSEEVRLGRGMNMIEKMKMQIKMVIGCLMKILLLPFRFCKVRDNRIIFNSLTGGNYIEYTCNPKYIYECLQRKDEDKYEIIWAFAHPEKYKFLEQQGVQLVKHFTWQTFYYLMTSKVVVTSGSYVPWISFRPNQTVIHTWHGGGAYKRLDNGSEDIKKMVKRRNAIAGSHVTLFVTSSKEFTRYVIRGAFAYQGEILQVGMPRNDFLVRGETGFAERKVREYYGIEEGTRILLYAPTYRENGTYERLNLQKVLKHLEQSKKEKWVCLERSHRYEAEEQFAIDDKTGEIKIASDYQEMQELLAASDVLITDYSSSIWDYSFLNRPCFLYVPDLVEYRRKRGFYVDIDEWQIPYAQNEKELLRQLEQIWKINWKERMETHHRKLGCQETGQAAECVVKYIEKICI